jgi:protoporphyrinogen oxidase
MATPRHVDRLRPGDRIVIAGAGPAGLTAAYLLSQRGYRVTTLEADDIVGGISRTEQHRGFRFDIGGHRFFTKVQPVIDLWDEILGDEFITVPRLSRILYRGKMFAYPLKPLNALVRFGPWTALLICLSYLKWHYRPYPREDNLEEWVTNRFGKRLYEIFFKTYTEKVWGIACTEIRAEWAAQRIKGLSLYRAILSAASITRRSEIKSLIDEFRYPRLGPGQMWERCAEKVRAMGNEVLLEHRVVSFDSDGSPTGGSTDSRPAVRRVRASTPSGTREFECEHVLSTLALRDLVHALHPTPPEGVVAAADGLSYRAFLVVALVLQGTDLFPDNWIYVHTPEVKVARVQNFNNWSRALVPEPDKTCLGLEYFCFEGDELWSSRDADLVALATRELEQTGLARGATVMDGTVIRMTKAYPIYDSEYGGHVQTIRSWIDAIPNLHTVGRNGMHKYNNQDHSMLTAMMAVLNMEGADHDIWAVNTDFEYHEHQRLDTSAPAAEVTR